MNRPSALTNFGHNVSITPEHYFEPKTSTKSSSKNVREVFGQRSVAAARSNACSLNSIETQQLYDNLALFRDTMVQSDPQGTFRNDWLDEIVFAESIDPE